MTYTTLIFQESTVFFYVNVPGQQTMANNTQATNGSCKRTELRVRHKVK